MDFITNNIEDIIAILTSVVTIASIVANKTNTDSDNKVVAVISKIVNYLALNFKKKVE